MVSMVKSSIPDRASQGADSTSRPGRGQIKMGKGQNRANSSQQNSADKPAQEADSLAIVPEVVEELTEEEVNDRHQLELKVERGIDRSGGKVASGIGESLQYCLSLAKACYCETNCSHPQIHCSRLLQYGSVNKK